MYRQKSYEQHSKGNLYIVATPIGNLEDITFRAINTLKEVDVIAAEDTRQTQKLLNHFEIHTPTISYHEHSREQRVQELITMLLAGKNIGLVSDAGLPAISDPGQELVARCIAEEIAVIPIPGVNAALSGLVASGLSTDSFLFLGFLPREAKKRIELLEQYYEQKDTLIFYEAPHRLKEMLTDLSTVLGNRKIMVARELTKRYEEMIHGTVEELLLLCGHEQLKGEMTVIIEGYTGGKIEESAWWEGLSVESHVNLWMEKGLHNKAAIKKVADERQVTKREIYNEYHQKPNE